MFRSVSVFALVVALAAPALAADVNDDYVLRPSYPDDWQESAIGIELGLRYWYALSGHSMSVFGSSYTENDTAHIGEAHFRIDDKQTSTYLKGWAGLSGALSGTFNTPASGGVNTASTSGRVYYAGVDFGYTPFGSENGSLGGFVGYQYWNDSPDMGRVNYGGTSSVNNIEYNMLRLGLSGKAQLTDQIDISAEAAIVPYAGLRGTYGAFSTPGGLGAQQSAGTVSGWLYGATGEVMVGFRPTENLVLRGGGRAWYLTGPATVNWQAGGSGYVGNTDTFTTFRYGLLAEISMKF